MTALATPTMTPTTRAVPTDARLTFSHLLRSEWIKLTSLRSTVWSVVLIVASGIGISLLYAVSTSSLDMQTSPSVGFTLTTVTIGLTFGQIIAAVLGVLAISGEYSTGMIRSTLTAVPSRLPVLAAKTLVTFGLVAAVGLVTLVASWAATYPVYAAQGIATGLTAPGFLLAILGGAAYLGLTAAFGLGVGAILRSSAGGVAVVLGVILGLQIFLPLASLAVEWLWDLRPFTFDQAGAAMASLPSDLPAGAEPEPGAPLEPWLGGLVVLAWTSVSLAFASILLRRRDA
ncbi:ABC transporter permease [Labedella endophytica]|uniref:ABC transporter permease n=1 Tax=Labedella endophytica TaxID=1523160 RepID=A0A433JMN1_9MICO|nr:ABC transporter permease subunit [Labedella endophytica]RUQ96935.1 ABC transporter permease [Labedella endophytica]